MPPPEFQALLIRYREHLADASTRFFQNEGIEPDWVEYFRNSSVDGDQAAREVLFYACNIWPSVEPMVDA